MTPDSSSPARPPSVRARERRRGTVVPLAIWAVAATTVAGAAVAFGYSPFASATWSRFDSGLYEDIARDGYQLFPCDSPDPGPPTWCGDAGWFPAYPWLMRGLHALGLPLQWSGVVLSWALAAATIVLLWGTFFRRRADVAIVAALVFAAFTPGRIYHYAIFPLSLLAVATIACLWLLVRERWVAAGLAGAVAALSYPLGVLLAPVSAAWILLERRVPLRERLRRVVIASGVMAAGFGLMLLVQWIETGRWNAYFLVQAKYDHRLQNPLAATWRAVEPLFSGPLTLSHTVAVQTSLVTIAVALVGVHALVRLRHGGLERVDVLLLLWLAVTWAFPLFQTGLSLQRSQAALLPLAILVVRLPRPLLLTLAVATIPVAVMLQKLFHEYAIV